MSISGITSNDSSYADAIGGGQMGKEAFMELLVQQLKNQDPLSPMDNDKFIAQLTQLSSLEGIQNLNENMVGLAMLQQGNALMSQLTQSSALIGKEVTYTDFETGEERTGMVQSVKIEDGMAVLNIDGQDVPLASVLEITEGDSTVDGGDDASDETDEGTEG
ncbi:MAG: flagellar hook capping protein [Planctomycetes bacterium]|nr:flagellar hook capping protein [Planctomycetota bacterium]